MFCGFVEMVPGTISVRAAKFRPFSGISVSFVELNTAPVWVDSVCRINAMSLTSTVSVA
jgi:hypothetical protein